ncbi:hypothetical protein L228DRAFT_24379 [Xylona heveae TC161]|uniref:Uncharacterized protein n=1 Tax=Xylona heveae (strain CBS 132557 / TC161) TaxID=1328760 RepID=A0A165ABD7_XYLHT|nr:hypothetical protein L228DRAFT_24379 [Xylona heveae TC161]KZF20207.1 hypothetical protein L228DRAFT_24379 [Xylona heveae TC161]
MKEKTIIHTSFGNNKTGAHVGSCEDSTLDRRGVKSACAAFVHDASWRNANWEERVRHTRLYYDLLLILRHCNFYLWVQFSFFFSLFLLDTLDAMLCLSVTSGYFSFFCLWFCILRRHSAWFIFFLSCQSATLPIEQLLIASFLLMWQCQIRYTSHADFVCQHEHLSCTLYL